MIVVANNPVTIEDIKVAENSLNSFGIDIGMMMGRITRRKPAPVVHDYIEIQCELIKMQ
jgi:hypothetical protein